MLVFLLVLAAALVFEYINGFHDAANAIATIVSTNVLTPRQAIALAASFNLAGGLLGTAVATTIGQGLVDPHAVTITTILAALLGAIIWNLLTWWLGLPSSSSHALVGGLCGAALASTHLHWSVLKWSDGLWPKVVVPMITSPALGFMLGALFMAGLTAALLHSRLSMVQGVFGKLQTVSAAWMALSHGSNDAQKTMGIITLALFTGTNAGLFQTLPPVFHFLQTPVFTVPSWVVLLCALTMALGTAAGGWRIIRTLGHRMVKLQPVHGFAAETSAALIIQVASQFGLPLSTTHVITTSIMGVGATKRFSAVKWGLVHRIVWAWLLTLPLSGSLGYVVMWLFQWRGLPAAP